MPLSRSDSQALSRTRVQEARCLLRARHFDGAYYLAGLAIECALKACIAKRTRRHEFPDKSVVNESYTHDLTKLLKVAGLESQLTTDFVREKRLEMNWTLVKDWRIDSRYGVCEQHRAQDIYRAITAQRTGVLQWIRRHW